MWRGLKARSLMVVTNSNQRPKFKFFLPCTRPENDKSVWKRTKRTRVPLSRRPCETLVSLSPNTRLQLRKHIKDLNIKKRREKINSARYLQLCSDFCEAHPEFARVQQLAGLMSPDGRRALTNRLRLLICFCFSLCAVFFFLFVCIFLFNYLLCVSHIGTILQQPCQILFRWFFEAKVPFF